MCWLVLAVSNSPVGAASDLRIEIPRISVHELGGLDLSDGSVGDWEDLLGAPLLTSERDFYPSSGWYTTSSGAYLYDPDDASWRIWLAWSEDPPRLYIAAEVRDDEFANEGFTGTRDEVLGADFQPSLDHLEVFVDGDGSGGEYGAPRALVGEDAYMSAENWSAQGYALFPAAGRGLLVLPSADCPWLADAGFSGGGGGSLSGADGSGWVVEVYVSPVDSLAWSGPAESVMSRLTEGRTIGVQVRVTDVDHIGGRNWTRTNVGGRDQYLDRFADDFISGTLAPATATTQVSVMGWGALKGRK